MHHDGVRRQLHQFLAIPDVPVKRRRFDMQALGQGSHGQGIEAFVLCTSCPCWAPRPHFEVGSLEVRAQIELDAGNFEGARSTADAALTLHASMGSLLGRRRVERMIQEIDARSQAALLANSS